jgi:hypothetical protein
MIKQNEIKVLLVANVHGGNLHHPDTEAIKGRCIRTNIHHYILKCIKCSVDLATAVEERNISQLDIKLQERRLNKNQLSCAINIGDLCDTNILVKINLP